MNALILVVLLLVLFEMIGYIFSNYCFGRTFKINILFGFFVFMAFFEILSFIPMLFNLNYYYFKILFVVVFTIIISTFIFLNYKKIKYKFKENWLFYISFLIASIIISIILYINSFATGDSWLYMPMILSGPVTGEIFNVEVANLQASSGNYHGLESLYLFIAIVGDLSNVSIETFALSYSKIFDAFFLTSSFVLISEGFFKKNNLFVFLLQVIGFVFLISFLTGNRNAEGLVIVSTIVTYGGYFVTLMLLPLALYYYLNRNSQTKSLLVLIIIVLAGVSFSSTIVYSIPFSFLVYAVIDIIIFKESKYISHYVTSFFILIYCYISMIVVNNDKSLFLFSLIMLMSYLVIFFICTKLSIRMWTFIVWILVFCYFSLEVIILYLLPNTVDTLKNIGSLEIAFPILGIIGLYKIYKYNQKYFIVIVVSILFYINTIAFATVGEIVNKAVYERSFYNIAPIVILLNGFVFIVESFVNKFKLSKTDVSASILILLVTISSPIYIHRNVTDATSLEEFKFVNKDTMQLTQYDFENGAQLDVSAVTPNYGKFSSTNVVSEIFKYEPGVERVSTCTSQCYILTSNQVPSPVDSKLVYSTDNYLLYWMD